MGVGRARHTRERLQAMTPMGSSAPQDLAEVYRTTYRALVRFLYRKVWDAERAEDLAQEAFARALIHKPESARGWLFIVAANMARDDARRAARERRHLTLLTAEPQESTLASDEAVEVESDRARVRVALDERALITRAGELLALAAPPDRELPPFRAGDMKPLTRLWWKVRLPLAWAATVAIALGIGTYLGRGVEQVPQAPTASDTQPAELQALQAPISADTLQRESRAWLRGAARTPPAAPAAPAPAARRETEMAAIRRDTALSAATPAPVPASQAAFVMVDGALVEKASPISLDSARALLGADPLAVPGAPIRTMYRAREIGYSAVVIVEQALDSSTVIEVVNGRRSPLALDAVVVTGAAAPVAQADSVSVRERAPLGRARIADSLAPGPAAKAAARLERYETQNRGLRRLGDLEVRVSGPLPSDSLQKLLRVVQPVKP